MNKNRKTSHILNVFQYDNDGHVILPASLTLTVAPASNDNSGKVGTTAWVRTYVTGLSYLTGNQSITVSGDATGSGTTSITLTLANSGVTAGIYGSTTLVPVVTVDSKGRITSVTTAAISGSLTFTGDVTGTGTTGTSTGLTLAASGVTAGTYTKVTVDTKGRVTVGVSATTSDISEGTNLYYTDARVLAYLGANNYATQSYVGTQIANLVSSAPATLDTLNELAAALGNDPSFATTTATSLGNRLRVDTAAQGLNSTQQSNGRTNLGLGSLATLSSIGNSYITDLAWSKLSSTPTTISGYGITNAYTDAQIQNFFNGANAISGYNKSNWDTAYGWGNHASGGYLTTSSASSTYLTSALAATTYVSLTGSYANPTFLTSLAYSKITGVPAFLTSYTEVDTLASVTGRGASTSTTVTFSGGASISNLLINGAPTVAESSLALGAMGTAEGGQLTLNKATSYTFAAHIDVWNDSLRFLYGTNTATSGVAMSVNLSNRQLILPLYTASNSFTGTAAGVLAFDSSGNIITIAVPGGAVSSVSASTGISVNATTGAITVTNTGTLTVTGTANQVLVNGGTAAANGNITLSLPQSIHTSATPTFDQVITGNNGNGTNFRIGDDVWIGDINTANTFRVQGLQDATQGYIVFGNSNATALGRSGTGALTYGGNTIYHAGNLTNLNQLTNGPGYLTSITSSQVTTALGFTPYNSTNPSGYISSYTETDTLSSVVARGSSTTAAISAANFQIGYQALNLDSVKTPGLYHYDGAYTGTQPIQNWYNIRTIEIGNSTRASQFVMPYNVDRIFYRRNTDPGWQPYVELYHTGNLPTIPTNNNQLTNGAGYLTSVTTITGNAGSATLLKSINTTTSVLSNWNPQSLTYQAWGQAWAHSSISADTGDMALWLRAGQYSAGGTEVCMIIDGDYYAASGAQKVLHAGNYNSYAVPLGGGTMSGQLISTSTAPLSWQAGGNSGTYTQTTIYANQNNTSASDANGIFIERGYTDTSNTELRRFVIGARGGTVQWRLDGPGNVTQTGGLTATYLTTSGEGNFGPDSGGNNGIRIRYGNVNGGYGMVRFHQDGTNHSTIHSFSASWQGGSFIGASAGSINIDGQYGATFGGWNVPYAHINSDGIYVKAWATPSGSTGWNANSVLRLQQGSTGNDVYIEMRNRADAGDHAAILFTDNNVGGYIGFRTYASNNVAAGSDCMIYGTYNDHIFQNGSSGTFNGKTETFRIYANGSVRATGDVTAYSDRRVKENIITIDNALEKTLQLRGVFYNRTDKDDKSQKVGVIAQEIQEVLPQVVNEDYNGLLSVSYGNITGVLIEAIKEQQIQIKELKRQIEYLVENK
jgi:hypothetical protein